MFHNLFSAVAFRVFQRLSLRKETAFALLLCVASTLATTPAAAQMPQAGAIAKTTLIADLSTRDEQGYFWSTIRFELPQGWHIYWQNPGDSGLPPTIEWQLPKGVKSEAIHWPVPHRFITEDIVNYGYSDTVIIPVLLQSAITPTGILRANVNWLVCKDVCIPESATLSFDTAATLSNNDKETLKNALNLIPALHQKKAVITRQDGALTIAVELSKDAMLSTSKAELFPISENWISTKKPPTFDMRGNWLVIKADATEQGSDENHFQAVISTHSSNDEPYLLQFDAQKVTALPTEIPASTSKSNITILTALLFALLGGLILNAMPCVLPVLSLKALSLAKIAEKSRRCALYNGLAYTAGILVSFALIGIILLLLKSGGQAVGWGFQLQSPAFVLALAIVTTFVTLNLMGIFELPVLFGNNSATTEGLAGSFFTGVLAVALATPCTAPFMAPALGFALTQPPLIAIAVLLSVGLGLALPYLLISISPGLRHILPRPGAWMLRFKQFLAFPMFATIAWLLWVLQQQTGSLGIIMGFCTVFLVALSVWGVATSSARASRLFWWAVMLTVIISSQTMPPQTVRLMPEIMMDSNDNAKPESFSLARISELNAAGKNVFVDATAAWCLTCKINERLVLHTQAVQTLFAKNNVTMMVADWTQRDDTITQFLASYNRSGVPFYVYYPAQGAPVVLPSVLTYKAIESAILSAK